MSMGQWDKLAGVNIKKGKKMELPAELIEILKRTRKLYSAISFRVNYLVETGRLREIEEGGVIRYAK